MSQCEVSRVALKGITATVPAGVVDNATQNYLVPPPTAEERRAFIETTGIRELRFAPKDVCASDLALQAGERLLSALKIPPDGVDLLIFLTQTPDYLGVPPTAPLLQHRLGLSTECAAYDLIQNCAGFILGAHAATSAAMCGLRVLLLIGETFSRTQSFKAHQGGLMFGDAAAACFFEPSDDASPIYFRMNSDGSAFDAIMIEAGGYRNPASVETLRERLDSDGTIRTLHQGRMDKMRVFDFAMRAAIPDIKRTLEFAQVPVGAVEKFYFHQANRQILERFGRKLDLSGDRIPLSLDRFGNTSTVSIPLGMVADLGDDQTHTIEHVVWSAFGGGLSWGTVLLSLRNCLIGKLTEYSR